MLICESLSTLVISPLAGYFIDLAANRQAPFLLALAFLAGSMLWIAAVSSLPFFIVGRVFQGAASAMVTVAGITFVLGIIQLDDVAFTLGWVMSANTAGFTIGPALGGILYKYGGWWTVFGTLFEVIVLDLFLLLAVVQKSEDSSRLLTERVDGASASSDEMEQLNTSPGQANPEPRIQSDFALLVLLKQPRMLIMLWGVIASGFTISAFDTVRFDTGLEEIV